MPAPLSLLLAMLVICLAMSTKADRLAARDRLRRFEQWFWIPAIVFGGLLLWPLIFDH